MHAARHRAPALTLLLRRRLALFAAIHTALDAYTTLVAERLAVLGKVAASHAPKNQV